MNLFKQEQHDFYYCEQCKEEIPILRYLLVHSYLPLHKQLFIYQVSETQYLWMLFDVNLRASKIQIKYIIEDHFFPGYRSNSSDNYKLNASSIEYNFSDWQLELYRNPILAQVRIYLHQPYLFNLSSDMCKLYKTVAKRDSYFAVTSYTS